ncbi:Uncharacterized protein BP5553_04892 [Venustampulla echinocandica]|uniref:FAD/NAD(P)-binding domain-containing protein n=1 Tax=Venustampulla echinocandica TaxID=2656787 RepID=A0A370TPL2_9HELO|nr:Uncharacterized protein BP5553_04892 [Venustampulla echinocandica]RDL37459.1 Uncharacterized protein BP5553_04892 [Venustampulla echinocandica]
MAAPVENADLVVIGAGWYGLAAAKTYLEVHPDAKLIILEAESSVGGVWADHRLYPSLVSNNMLGTYEYSDFPMDEETWGVKPGQHIPGKVLHDYLTKYAEHFGVLQQVRLNSKVETAERGVEGGWLLRINHRPGSILARKLVVATGVASEAFLPTLEGQESFGVPLFHSKDMLQHVETLETTKLVTVLGSTKSGWDAVYAYGSKGIKVNWVIRASGHGPCWMAPPYVTPLKKWLEKLIHTRFLTWLSPCVWADADGYGPVRRFFHGTAIGRFFVDRFWAILRGDLITLNNYDSHHDTAKLKPWISPFWIATGLGILNYETDFFELVKRGNVKVHVADITQLSKGKVHLSSDEILDTDALILATGWKRTTSIKFLPPGLEAQLGLPSSKSNSNSKAEQASLTARADAEILSRYPRLKDQPEPNKMFKPLSSADPAIQNEESLSALNLYRFMVPTDAELLAAHDIAFAGNLMTITTSIVAQTQALWITAYFDGKVSPLASSASILAANPTSQATDAATEPAKQIASVRYSARLHNRFGKWRTPGGFGATIPDFAFDAMPYLDMLLVDLGLRSRRKAGFLKEVFEPYGPEDYVGIVKEWVNRQPAVEAGNTTPLDKVDKVDKVWLLNV